MPLTLAEHAKSEPMDPSPTRHMHDTFNELLEDIEKHSKRNREIDSKMKAMSKKIDKNRALIFRTDVASQAETFNRVKTVLTEYRPTEKADSSNIHEINRTINELLTDLETHSKQSKDIISKVEAKCKKTRFRTNLNEEVQSFESNAASQAETFNKVKMVLNDIRAIENDNDDEEIYHYLAAGSSGATNDYQDDKIIKK